MTFVMIFKFFCLTESFNANIKNQFSRVKTFLFAFLINPFSFVKIYTYKLNTLLIIKTLVLNAGFRDFRFDFKILSIPKINPQPLRIFKPKYV